MSSEGNSSTAEKTALLTQISRNHRVMVENLRPVFLWDRLYIGGGNSRLLTGALQERLGDDVVIVPNSAGILGGVRAWSLRQ